MVTCEVCGSVEFEKYAGFMYCVVCQTQTEDYHEQEYEYQVTDTVRKEKKKKGTSNAGKSKEQEDGSWTSWEAFNYILYGMTQELKKVYPLPYEFQFTVLKLWAAYLKACDAGFISYYKEALPKLQYNFKHRDARVLYNIDVNKYVSKRKRTKSSCSSISNISNTTPFTESKRSQGQRRNKVIVREYNELLSASMSNTDLTHETLETLGRSNVDETTTDQESGAESEQLLTKCFKEVFTAKNYRMYKKVLKSQKSRLNAKDQAKKSVKCLAKNKLLSILHLALLMIGSEVQLSDLLRLIRESHISYAKVTQFLPKEMKFGKNDITYIDVISDQMMPTHLNQRKISSQLAYLIRIDKIYVPNMKLLVRRYCLDLNLPDEIACLSEKILANWVPRYTIPRSRSLLPNYEAWAMVSIIFVLKLLFGLNDHSELFLSDLASHINSEMKRTDRNLFVFEDWQKFIECRKAVLIEYHYPTQEQLNSDSLTSSKKFLQVLTKENKDEHRAQRFIPYAEYFLDNNFMGSVRQMLTKLTEPMILDFMEFEPSLTPQSSYLDAITKELKEKTENENSQNTSELPREILNQSFKHCSVNFAFKPDQCLKLLKSKSVKSMTNLRCFTEKSDVSMSSPVRSTQLQTDSLFEYWVYHYTNTCSSNLSNFKHEVLGQVPENFQWLITECSRMLEMNIRDIYNELIKLEKFLIDEGHLRNAVLFT